MANFHVYMYIDYAVDLISARMITIFFQYGGFALVENATPLLRIGHSGRSSTSDDGSVAAWLENHPLLLHTDNDAGLWNRFHQNDLTTPAVLSGSTRQIFADQGLTLFRRWRCMSALYWLISQVLGACYWEIPSSSVS